jgi:CarD family transcriptional regulator
MSAAGCRDSAIFSIAKETILILTTGSKIVYPSQGPCLIGPLIEKVIDEQSLMFYKLLVLHGNGGSLFIPVDKVATVGIRRLLEQSEIPKLMAHMSQSAALSDNYRQRRPHISKLFTSGSAFDLAEIIGSLTEVNRTKSLSFGERKILERAKELLACEMAEVMGITMKTAEDQIEAALEMRAREARTGASVRRTITTSRDQLRYQAVSG